MMTEQYVYSPLCDRMFITGDDVGTPHRGDHQMTDHEVPQGAGWMSGEECSGEGRGWMNGEVNEGEEANNKRELNYEMFSDKENGSEDAITMVISPDLPYHLLSPSPEDIEDFEEEAESEDTMEEDGKVYTDSLNEMCLCVCKICSTKMKFNSLREHVRIQHSLRMSQYKQQYGKIAYSRMTYHRCKGCGKVLRAIYATIKKHLQTVHSLSFKEYATKYHVFKGRFEKKEEQGSSEEDRVYSNEPSQMCMTVCKVCNTNLEPYNMKNHVKGKHYLSMLEYKSNFGDIEFISEIFHRCKVCEKSVLFEYQKLSNHLFFNHGIGIAKYKDFLLGKTSLESLKQSEPQSPKQKTGRAAAIAAASNGTPKSSEDAKRTRSRRRSRPATGRAGGGGSSSADTPFLNPFLASQPNLNLALLHSIQANQSSQQQNLQQQQQQGGAHSLLQTLQYYQTLLQNPFLMQALNYPGLSPEMLSSLVLGQSLSASSSDQDRSGQSLSSLMNIHYLSSLMSNPSLSSLMNNPSLSSLMNNSALSTLMNNPSPSKTKSVKSSSGCSSVLTSEKKADEDLQSPKKAVDKKSHRNEDDKQ